MKIYLFNFFIQFSLALRWDSSIWRWSEKSHTRIRIVMQMKWTLPFAARKRCARALVRSGQCDRDNVTWTVTNLALRHPNFVFMCFIFLNACMFFVDWKAARRKIHSLTMSPCRRFHRKNVRKHINVPLDTPKSKSIYYFMLHYVFVYVFFGEICL